MNTTSKPDMMLWLNDARGVYIPRDFASSFADRAFVTNVDEADWEILEAGPDHEFYWDVWHEVLDNAIVCDGDIKYRLHQEGDLWLVPVGMEWDCEIDNFVWPEEDNA